jgi:hypothetical protein
MNTTTTTEQRESRPYPYTCRSAYCARTECDGCPFLAELQAFKAWRNAHAAVVLDQTWSPCTYTATR